MPLRSRNKVVLAKVESTSGTDSIPVVATDALLVNEVSVVPKPNILDSPELRGVLDAGIPVVGVTPVEVTLAVPLKASGAAGTAPETQPLLLACGLAETIRAATGPTTAAGGTATTFTIDTGLNPTWPTTTALGAALIGVPVSLSGNPAIAKLVLITDYTVAAGIATVTVDHMFSPVLSSSTVATIPQTVRYQPSSAQPSSITIYVYVDGLLWKVVGCRGELEVVLKSGEKGMLNFTFQGLYGSKTDVALPAGSTVIVDSARPQAWKNGRMSVGRLQTCIRDFSLKMNNQFPSPDCPNAVEGLDPPEIVSRDLQGTANPMETLVATRDIFGDFRAEIHKPLGAIIGTVAGNRVGLTVRSAKYRSEEQQDRDGFVAVNVPFSATGTDDGFQLSHF